MRELDIAKLAIAAAGLAVFLTGVRTEVDTLRWLGIGLVAVAFFLRFIGGRGKRPRPGAPGDSGGPGAASGPGAPPADQ